MSEARTTSTLRRALPVAAAFALGVGATLALLRGPLGSGGAETAGPAPPPEERLVVDERRVPERGAEAAPITLVVFADFQCPFCSRANDVVARLLAEHPEQVRVQFRHLPLASHRAGLAAHRAALAAERQGRFWEMHDLLSANPRRLSRDALFAHAKTLALDLQRFERDLDDPSLDRLLERDRAEAERLGIAEAPALVMNGQILHGAHPYASVRELLERELARASGSPPASIDEQRLRRWVAVTRQTSASE